MALFENFPYTNFHEMNLDYLLKRVKELEALIAAGSVIDVKANVSGNWVSQKDADGIVNLPAGDENTIGGLKFASTADTEEPFIALSNGGGWEKVPALNTYDKIDATLLPPTTDVLMNNNGVWVSVVDGNGDAEIAKATPTLYGTVKVESSNDLGARKMKIHADGQYDTLPTLDANDQIAASAIPNTGVAAGNYGTTGDDHNYTAQINIPYVTIGSDGRISTAYNNPYPRLFQLGTTIAAGNVIGSLQFNGSYMPDNNHVYWAAPFVFTYASNGMGGYVGTPLYEGIDYTWSWSNTGTVSIRLNSANTDPVYVIVYGYLARPAK